MLAVQRRFCKKLGWDKTEVDEVQLIKTDKLKAWKALREIY